MAKWYNKAVKTGSYWFHAIAVTCYEYNDDSPSCLYLQNLQWCAKCTQCYRQCF